MGFNYVCDTMKLLQIILFAVILNCSFSQQLDTEYNIEGIENIENDLETKFKDSIALRQYLSDLRTTAWEANYIEFSIDEIGYQNGKTLIAGDIGHHYENLSLIHI